MSEPVPSAETLPSATLCTPLREPTPQGGWLRGLSTNWPAAVCRALLAGAPAVVRVAIADVRGSAPREPGACLLISESGLQGTVGGGNLEWHAVRAARELLHESSLQPSVRIERLILAKELAQCCGGVVQLWIERFTLSDLPLLSRAAAAVSQRSAVLMRTELLGGRVSRVVAPASCSAPRWEYKPQEAGIAHLQERVESNLVPLWLLGGGHVGQALVRILEGLPFETTWIDTRAGIMPTELPENVHPLLLDDPLQRLGAAPDNTRFLVMTHDHALDYDVCHAILHRNRFAWLGLIGSRSKGARFRSRLARDGMAPELIDRLVCPIGVSGIVSKQPEAIAIAVAAQLLQINPEIEAPAARAIEPCPATDCVQCGSARDRQQP